MLILETNDISGYHVF